MVRAFPGINSTLAVWLLAGVSCITGALLAFLLQPKHVLDWPLSERQSARLLVDGQQLPLSDQNPLHLRTSWFAKSIVLEPAGFRSVQFDVHGTRALLAPTLLRPAWTPTATQGLLEQLARLTRTTHTKLRFGASPTD